MARVQPELSLRQLEDHQRHLPAGCIPSRPEKAPHHFGKIAVAVDALRARLGPTTWRVWWHAEQVASWKDGLYFEGRERCASALSISEHAVKRAITRLVDAGLMRVEGRRRSNAGTWWARRYVLGHFAKMPGENVVLVPATTHLWMQAPERRGGRREGAGRPPGSGDLANSNTAPHRPLRKSNTAPQYSNTAPPITTSVNKTSIPTPNGVGAAGAAPSGGSSQVTTGFNPPPAGVSTEVSGDTLVLRGKMRGGGGPPPPGHGGVPRFPGPTVLLPATVPGPREIPEELSDADAVEWALKAYRGCVEARTKKKCWVFCRKGEAQKSKHWSMLLAAVKHMREQRWQPGAWVLWASGIWHERTKKPPPLKFIFNTTFMVEQANWFEHELGHFCASRVVYNDAAKAILYRYQSMREELMQSGAETPDAVKSVVEKFFPNDSYESSIAAANARTREDQAIINMRIQRGDFLW